MALFTLGILLFLLIAADIIKTTLSTRGGGTLTNAVTRSVWALFFRAAGRQGRCGLLQYAGQFVVLSVLLSWILGLWASLFLLFASHPGSIVDDATKLPADLWETFYYAGFTLSTLGVGDYAAAADGWRVLTSAAAFCGLTFITAAITYIVPVLSAVSLQNQLSLLVSSMGRTPQEILVNSWNGADFSSFYDNVPELRQMLGSAVTRHLELQRASYLGRTRPSVGEGDVDLTPLAAAAIPLDEDRVAIAAHDERRRLLSALLESDGWSWRDVYGDSDGN